MTKQVGSAEAALAAHRAVLALRQDAGGRPGADAGVKADVGRSLTEVASLLDLTGKREEAMATYRRSEALLAGLADSDPAARGALAACRTRDGPASRNRGPGRRCAGGLPVGAGRPGSAGRTSQGPRTTPVSSWRIRSVCIGHLLWYTSTSRERQCPSSARRWRSIGSSPTKIPACSSSASAWRPATFISARRCHAQASRAEAEAELRTVLALYQKLADENPAVTVFRYRSGVQPCVSACNLRTRASRRRPSTARRLTILQKLADENPAVVAFRSGLAVCRMKLGRLLLQMGKPAEAEDECRAAVAILRKLAEDNPAVTSFRGDLAYALIYLGDVERSLGQAADGQRRLRTGDRPEGIAAKDGFDEPGPGVTVWRARFGGAGSLGSISATPPAPRPMCDGRSGFTTN